MNQPAFIQLTYFGLKKRTSKMQKVNGTPCGLPSVQPIIHPCIFTNLCRLNLLSTCTASYVSEIGSRRSYTGLLFSFCTPTNTHYVPQCYIKSRRRCTPFRKFNFVFYVVCETPASTAALFFSTFECGSPPFFLFKLDYIVNLCSEFINSPSVYYIHEVPQEFS